MRGKEERKRMSRKEERKRMSRESKWRKDK
jgi:hypothetical protein